MKKVCIATATRAEYGLLKPLLSAIKNDSSLSLQLLVTGSHLSPEFGLTYKAIEADGFKIDHKVEMLLSADTGTSIVKSMGLGMISFADALEQLHPGLLIILGDRYEMLALASSATVLRIPIAHIHGGEITEGAYDDAIRHAITKLSHLHFTSTAAYRERVIQMGEQPHRVFHVGAIGLDNITTLKLLSKEELEKQLGIKFRKYNYLITFHPETLLEKSAKEAFLELLNAINSQQESCFIFTKANADTDGRIINTLIDEYVQQHSDKAIAFVSMGQLRYLSAMKQVNAVVGNSSSGIIEAPSLGAFTINIGDRQKGRIQAKSIFNTPVEAKAISAAFTFVREQSRPAGMANPYDNGNVSSQILQVIKNTDLASLTIKSFYNLPQ